MLMTKRTRGAPQESITRAPLATVFAQGFLTNALNPKVALFFLAFLPQFIAVDAAQKTLAFLFLGSLFNVTGTLWNVFVAWAVASAAAKADPRIRESSVVTWMTRSIGALFLVIGVRLAFSEVKSS